jgi:hypothetical protein
MTKITLALALLLPLVPTQEKTVTVSGTVKLNGPVPKAKVNKALLADPACAGCQKGEPMKDDLVVDDSGGVRWAIVYVKKGLEGKKFDPPADAVVFDQVGCTYVPHVAGAMVGQKVTYKNSDPLLHNVKGLPFANKEFNYGQVQGSSNDVRFTAPELPVKVVCNVHPFMASFVGVFEHPFYAVTDAAGNFEIKNLPPGNYVIGVWHEKLQGAEQNIEAKEGLKMEFQVK